MQTTQLKGFSAQNCIMLCEIMNFETVRKEGKVYNQKLH